MKRYGLDLLKSRQDLDTEALGVASGLVSQQLPIFSSPAARLPLTTAPRLADAASGPGPAA